MAPRFPRSALERSIPARFAEQAALHADRPAVHARDAAWTYAELDRRSAAVAAAIAAATDVGPEPVLVHVRQGALLVATILGALRAGKAYVPLDPGAPRTARAAVAELVAARLVLTAGDAPAPPELAALALRVDELPDEAAWVDPPLEPDRLAYVYPTSGTTGSPKGVMDTHRNVLHNVLRYTNALGIGPDDRLSLLQGPAFSGAVSSTFGALLNGACTCPYDVADEGVAGLGAWLERAGITIYHSVPALFRQAFAEPRALPALRLIRLEGDRATPRDLALFRERAAPGWALVNGLGATECGIVRQLFVRPGDDLPGPTVPIGYPVEDMDVRVVGEAGVELPPGEVGELVVESAFLSPGYWGRPDLTAERFADAPGRPGVRRYRTGDLGRLRPDGCLEHLGRADFQAKVRGQRVELDVVEAALRESGLVADVAVGVREDAGGRDRLVAWVVAGPRGTPSPRELRGALAGRVLRHAVPSAFVEVAAIPLGANAKVDLRSLPDPPGGRAGLGPLVAPTSALEERLVAIWEDVLGREPVGVEDDFLDLGGDSLLAALVATEVERATGIDVAADALARAPTIAQLAAALETGRAGAIVSRFNADGGRLPLVFLHGDYLGGGLYVRRLAELLGAGQPLVAVAPPRLEPDDPRSIEGLAAETARLLRDEGVRPPFALGGFGHAGGLVAYELARLLERAGAPPARLVLVATACGRPEARHVRRALDLVGAALGDDTVTRRRRYLALRDAMLRRAAPSDDRRHWVWDGEELLHRWLPLVQASAPGRYGGPLDLVWCRNDPEVASLGRWPRLAPATRTTIVPGTFASALTVELDAVAAAIRDALA